jgi:hypothetical protein
MGEGMEEDRVASTSSSRASSDGVLGDWVVAAVTCGVLGEGAGFSRCIEREMVAATARAAAAVQSAGSVKIPGDGWRRGWGVAEACRRVQTREVHAVVVERKVARDWSSEENSVEHCWQTLR